MKRLHLNLNLNGIIVAVAVGVLLPVTLLTGVGITAIAMAKDVTGIITGILVICFAVAAIGSASLAVTLTGRKARLARRQADFVANVSHEFRTPLSAIKLYTQTLQSGKLDKDPEKIRDCLATIERETEWLDLMIDRVLTWRAASQDMMPLAMTTAPITETVKEAVHRFQSMVAPEELTFSTELESCNLVQHDAHAIHGIILNLLTNAYKYSGAKKEIQVRLRDQGSDVIIEIQDNGLGMTDAEMKRIFHAFYRGDMSDGNSRSGVGLGLAIVHYLVERHDGTITVKSKKDHGSTFTIRLPAAEPTA